MEKIVSFEDFSKIELRVGTILEVKDFPNARQPAYQLVIDFGAFGIKKTSAQITVRYKKEELLNKQIVAVLNFPKKQIANFMSDCLVVGAVERKEVILLHPEIRVENGALIG